MGSEWDRYGIEPSASARACARRRGITLLGANIDDPGLRLPELGVIVLIDVIEHLPKPMNALRRLSDALVEGGRLVIFTGDTRAWAWRFSGRHYWYSALPEHVVFFGEMWFRWAAPRLRCTLGRRSRHSHDPAPLRRRMTETLQNLAYLASQQLTAIPQIGRRVAAIPLVRRMEHRGVAWWTSSKDHMLVELIKNGATGTKRAAPVRTG
jgi:SAM-dependent methyltransferase